MRSSGELTRAVLILGRPEVAAVIPPGVVVIGAVAWLAAEGLGWSRTASVLAGAGLALALAVTLARPGLLVRPAADPLLACRMEPPSLRGAANALNVMMLMPFAFFGALASRRPLAVVLCCLALSVAIEVVQGCTGIGVCESNDVLTNTLGAALAAPVGWLCALALASGRRVRNA